MRSTRATGRSPNCRSEVAGRNRRVPFELIKPDTRIDFVGQAKYVIAFSLLIVAAGLAAMALREPPIRLGVDFTGGMEIQLHFAKPEAVDETRIRDVLTGFDLEGSDV